MIEFLLKGILRDKSRSVLPIIIVAIGVMLTVTLSGYLTGVMGDLVDQNARFDTGHVKITTRAYSENESQIPNDLALLGVEQLLSHVRADFPDMEWVERIRFGGIIDVPDELGNTVSQGPAAGLSFDLFSELSSEIERFNVSNSLVTGVLPTQRSEVLLGHDFSIKLKVELGDEITFIGSTMNGSMAFSNMVVVGTVRFGASILDRGLIITDISDAKAMLDMEDGAGEVLGYFNSGAYDHNQALKVRDTFNKTHSIPNDEFSPLMEVLQNQNNLAGLLEYADSYSSIFVAIFVLAMSVVLWNTGLLAGLRRYREFGIRLALGESKGHIYRSLVYEALLVGTIGSILGTLFGLAITWYMQVEGVDISEFMTESSMLMPSVIRSKFTPSLLYIGFIPGLFAMVLGNALSGWGIYRRETAQLFKELEV